MLGCSLRLFVCLILLVSGPGACFVRDGVSVSVRACVFRGNGEVIGSFAPSYLSDSISLSLSVAALIMSMVDGLSPENPRFLSKSRAPRL